ncbi:MAG: DUF481 domain-containing protein [Undibacterium sp.]|nr:DUF481 domain-containing protein [Opitutaceae bacterium]
MTGLGLGAGALPAAEGAAATLADVLIYRDGDRVRGRLMERVGDTLVFQSEKFGLLKVPAAMARVEQGALPAASKLMTGQQATQVISPPSDHAEPTESAEPVGWARFSPYALTQAMRELFGPWHGRFAVSSEIVSDRTERNNTMVEARLNRKWTADEVEGTIRFDYTKTEDVTTKDVVKFNGSWRRDLKRRLFGVYRPSVEYNRAFKNPAGVFTDYILVQQEIGAGVNVFTTPQRKLRVGLSENLFDVWVMQPVSQHTARTSESVFAEVEWTLPWKLRLTERGVWYYSFANNTDGWENRIELNKKLTETLSVAIRHETRHNNPDVRTQDYTLLRLLIGLDF